MKKILASGIAAALTMSVAMPAFAEDGAMSSSASTSTSSSSSTSSSMSSSSSSVKKPVGPGVERLMKAKEKANKTMSSSKPTIDATCMQTAVEKRDTALMAGVDTYTASVKSALQVRKDAIKAAWALTDKTARNAANKAAWTAFQGTWRKASQAMKATKKTVWQTFRTEAKACGQTGADSSGEGIDAGL